MRRTVARAAGVVAPVLAVAAGWLFLSGTYGRWQDDRALDAACGGTVDPGGKQAAKPVYRLSAFYGTFADDQRRLTSSKKGYTSGESLLTSFADWAEARCPGTPATAVYAISKMPTRTAGRPHTYTRKALEVFAERSAKRHGRTDVRVR